MPVRRLTIISAAAMAIAAIGPLAAQDYPIRNKPINIVVPFAAGAPTDRIARDLAASLAKPLGATIVIDNTSGGPGGLIGASKVASAAPDGHTLLLHHISMGIFPALVRNLPFSVQTDFEYLGMINEMPMTLIGRNNLPAGNFSELRQWAKANKGKIYLANTGIGSSSQLCGLLFQAAIGVDMTTVPYKGTGPAMTDLLGGQVDLICDQTTATAGLIEARKVKAYGVTTAKRLTTPALKHLPTLQEEGLKDFQVGIWHGLYAPKGTSPAVQKKINEALHIALKDPEFVKKQEALGAIIISDKRTEIADHKRFVASEIEKWSHVIKASGKYPE